MNAYKYWTEVATDAIESVNCGIVATDIIIRDYCEAEAASKYLSGCSAQSKVTAMKTAASVGLRVGPLWQHAAYIPRKGACVFDVMYKGILHLLYRVGHLSHVECNPVYVGEVFDCQLGTAPMIRHVPDFTIDRSKKNVIAVYSIFHLKDGQRKCHIMAQTEIEAIRKKYSKQDDGPWGDSWVEMARKTCIKQGGKTLYVHGFGDDQFEIADEVGGENQHKSAIDMALERVEHGRPKRPTGSDNVSSVGVSAESDTGNDTREPVDQRDDMPDMPAKSNASDLPF